MSTSPLSSGAAPALRSRASAVQPPLRRRLGEKAASSRLAPRVQAAPSESAASAAVPEIVAPSSDFVERARVKSREDYEAIYNRSLEDPSGFWSEIASEFYWETRWEDDGVVSANMTVENGPISIEWFRGGRTNICYNAVDRHCENGRGEQTAFIWEGNDVGAEDSWTFDTLREKVCQIANYLKECGVKKGDTVTIYMPMLMELPAAMLACARIGAVHSVVFGGFSADALAGRIIDSDSKVVLTASAVKRGAKTIKLKEIVNQALKKCEESGASVNAVITYDHATAIQRKDTEMVENRDVWWQDKIDDQPKSCDIEWVGAEDPLFMLYTSGSTGIPKGVQHTTGGYMIWTATTFKYAFDVRDDDIYWCTADCGWITGHSYLTYGPLLNGTTCVVFEGIPNYPDAGRCWEICDKYGVSLFYTAPTAIRALQKAGDSYPSKYSLSTLRVLGSVGEPINPEAWKWYFEKIGLSKCPISDTWWQTETGGHMIFPIPGAWPQKPGSATLPFFGVQPALLDQDGKEIEGEGEGMLCVKHPWPGMMRTVRGNHQRFEETYFRPFNGYYFSGDGARRDADGYYWLTGRVDDVINVSGHRIGTAEVESSLVHHDACAEAAVVGVEHPIKGQGIYAYVTLMDGFETSDGLKKELKNTVREIIGPFASPDSIHWAPALPKTRSGKIMRRILRKIASGDYDQLGDTSTLADPGVVDTLIDLKGK